MILVLTGVNLGEERLVYFKKMGNKIILVQPNLIFRSSSSNKLEKKSIEEAFAKSVLFGFKIYKSTKADIFIDLTPFLMQDMHGVSDRLEKRGEGKYIIDENRSAIFLERTKNFPKNSEFDVMITFSGNSNRKTTANSYPLAEKASQFISTILSLSCQITITLLENLTQDLEPMAYIFLIILHQ